jgi:hypothetical protein
VWSSARATRTGPWRYDLDVTTAAGNRVALRASGLGDTTYSAPTDLETNTSYRWSVTARLSRGDVGDTVRRTSASTFVILEPGQPLATLLYQNFPNPFPTPSSPTTCIWFDLHDRSTVQLDVRDLRGNLVRTLLPSPDVGTVLDPGRYGRGSIGPSGEGTGCDPRFRWDGRANDGRNAPNGVYLLRLAADGTSLTRKIVLQR